MIKIIIKRIFEWIFISIILTFIILIHNSQFDNIIDWDYMFGFSIGYFICLIIRVPYNKKEIELDEYFDKHNKNGLD